MKLATWLMECAHGDMPKNNEEITSKMKAMLRARHKFNRKRKFGAGSIPLRKNEVNFVNSSGITMWYSLRAKLFAWFQAHGLDVELGKDKPEDAKRAAKMTKATYGRSPL